jgi:hypothetical protein
LLLLGVSWTGTYAQREGERYFPETGHWVRGPFLEFYERADNPELVYGYPITEAFEDEVTESGKILQYFQRARFELSETSDGLPVVVLSPLGNLLHTPGVGQPLSFAATSSACRHFPEVDYSVCYAFLDFFESQGGVEQFGYPRSDLTIQDERLVQYFDNARFTWNPKMPGGRKVQLSELGQIYFYRYGENPARLKADVSGSAPRRILDLDVRAFTDRALISSNGRLTLYVIVQDQTLQPVENAQVTFSLTTPEDGSISFIMDPTDENGITQLPLQVTAGDEVIGLVQIRVNVTYNGFKETTQTSFRIWW